MKQIKKFDEFFRSSVLENHEEEESEYSFEELSPEAKEKALETLRDINVDYDGWHESVIDDFKSYMEEKFGVEDVEVQYSGFYSQGDGASFTGKVTDMEKFLKNALKIESSEFIDIGDDRSENDLDQLMGDLRGIGFDNRERLGIDDIWIEIERTSSRYSHENTIAANLEFEHIDQEDDQRDWNDFYDKMESDVTDWAREKSVSLYRRLEEEYDYLTSDPAVEETILANDYKFSEDGKLL